MLNPFRDQFVRDLFWILTNPQMMQSAFAMHRSAPDMDWLKTLDRKPQTLHTHLADKNLRMLGTYFEALWEYYLRYYPGNTLLAKNLQVFADNATLGEFDFIYRDQVTGEFRHLEVAVKYYLGLPPLFENTQPSLDNASKESSPQRYWFGPGSADRLDLKYNKLTQYQSQLSQTGAGRRVLEKLGIDRITPQICLLGYLFYPWNETQPVNKPSTPPPRQVMFPPEQANPRHLRGHWLRMSQLPQLLDLPCLWQLRHKPHWLAPVFSHAGQLMSNDDLLHYLTRFMASKNRPCLISRFELATESTDPASSPDDRFVSKEQLFVVPDGWPESAINQLGRENR